MKEKAPVDMEKKRKATHYILLSSFGKTIKVDYENDDTVGDLKIYIEQETAIPAIQQTLAIKNKLLKDDEQLLCKLKTRAKRPILCLGKPVENRMDEPIDDIIKHCIGFMSINEVAKLRQISKKWSIDTEVGSRVNSDRFTIINHDFFDVLTGKIHKPLETMPHYRLLNSIDFQNVSPIQYQGSPYMILSNLKTMQKDAYDISLHDVFKASQIWSTHIEKPPSLITKEKHLWHSLINLIEERKRLNEANEEDKQQMEDEEERRRIVFGDEEEEDEPSQPNHLISVGPFVQGALLEMDEEKVKELIFRNDLITANYNSAHHCILVQTSKFLVALSATNGKRVSPSHFYFPLADKSNHLAIMEYPISTHQNFVFVPLDDHYIVLDIPSFEVRYHLSIQPVPNATFVPISDNWLLVRPEDIRIFDSSCNMIHLVDTSNSLMLGSHHILSGDDTSFEILAYNGKPVPVDMFFVDSTPSIIVALMERHGALIGFYRLTESTLSCVAISKRIRQHYGPSGTIVENIEHEHHDIWSFSLPKPISFSYHPLAALDSTNLTLLVASSSVLFSPNPHFAKLFPDDSSFSSFHLYRLSRFTGDFRFSVPLFIPDRFSPYFMSIIGAMIYIVFADANSSVVLTCNLHGIFCACKLYPFPPSFLPLNFASSPDL